jgi:hypothetical protein
MAKLSDKQKSALEIFKSIPLPKAPASDTKAFLQKYGGKNIFMTIQGHSEPMSGGSKTSPEETPQARDEEDLDTA